MWSVKPRGGESTRRAGVGREEAQAEHVRPPGVWAGGGRGPAGGVGGRRGDRAMKPAKPEAGRGL